MIRHCQARRAKCKFSDQDLMDALQDLEKNRGSIRKTAAIYGIPYSMLRDHHKGISKKRYGGWPTVLTYDEERDSAVLHRSPGDGVST
jgi:hypothetical protein